MDAYVTTFKDFVYLPMQTDADHVAGVQKIAIEAEVFAAEAANATAFLVAELCETFVRVSCQLVLISFHENLTGFTQPQFSIFIIKTSLGRTV